MVTQLSFDVKPYDQFYLIVGQLELSLGGAAQ